MRSAKPNGMVSEKFTRVGKAQAREQLPALVDSVAAEKGPIEITDYGTVVALLISPKDYGRLCARAHFGAKPKLELRGSAVLLGDLQEASRQVSSSIAASIEKTANEL